MELYYFNEELPLCLEYGMTPHQFWDEDIDLFYAYEKAYINRIHRMSFLQGRYVFDAITMATNNAFKGKNEKATDYYKEDVYNPYKTEIDKKEEKYINSIDTSKSNTGLNNIKAMRRERNRQNING